MLPEQKNNSKNNLFRTLEIIASKEEQEIYKDAVPFVDIPGELTCQWEGAFIKSHRWFRDIWTDQEWKALCQFDKEFERICKVISEKRFPDVPEVFDDVDWMRFMEAASKTIDELGGLDEFGRITGQ